MRSQSSKRQRVHLTNTLVDNLKPTGKWESLADDEVVGLQLRMAPTGAKIFQARCHKSDEPNKRITVTLGSATALTVAEARKRARKEIAKIEAGRNPIEEKKARTTENRTFRQFLEEDYGPWLLANRKSGAATLARLKKAFGPVDAPVDGDAAPEGKTKPAGVNLLDLRLRSISTFDIEKWRTHRLKQERWSGLRKKAQRSGEAETVKVRTGTVSPATVNRDLMELRAALYKAVQWGLIDAHPMKGFKFAKEDGKVRFLEDDELLRLLQALDAREADIRAKRASGNEWRAARNLPLLPDLQEQPFADHLKPMVLISLNTGLRRGELFNLQWADINFERRILTVRAEVAKSGKARHVPLNTAAFDTLKQWRSQVMGEGLVFEGEDGRPFDNVNSAWEGLLKDAKIEGFRWHDMRHDFASRLVMAGIPLNTVRDLLGHADLKTTLRYAHLAPDVKAAAVEVLAHKPADNVVAFPGATAVRSE